LDVFLPENASGKLPVVLFVYGGGMVKGDKRLPPSKGTIYANVGNYFAKLGFVGVCIDYRLFGVHEGCIFPSGGEDVGLAVDWITKSVKQVDPAKVFLLGSSAGCAPFLLPD
jgi:acetyl esterase/lipase